MNYVYTVVGTFVVQQIFEFALHYTVNDKLKDLFLFVKNKVLGYFSKAKAEVVSIEQKAKEKP